MFRSRFLLVLMFAAAWRPMPALGDDITQMGSNAFGYTGSYTQYNTLADAQNMANSVGSGTIGQTDLSLFFSNNMPTSGVDYYPNANYFQTAWFYSTSTAPGAMPGDGNPSNNLNNFIQIANDTNLGDPLIGTSSSYWNASLTQYTLTASGSDADLANSAARFLSANSGGSTNNPNSGFVSYSLNATFSGLNAATYVASDQAYASYGDTATMSVSGTFTAIFYDANSGLYDDISLTLNNISWAYDNQNAINEAAAGNANLYSYMPGWFISSAVVPEPSSLTLAAIAGVTIFGASASRRLRLRFRSSVGSGSAPQVD